MEHPSVQETPRSPHNSQSNSMDISYQTQQLVESMDGCRISQTHLNVDRNTTFVSEDSENSGCLDEKCPVFSTDVGVDFGTPADTWGSGENDAEPLQVQKALKTKTSSISVESWEDWMAVVNHPQFDDMDDNVFGTTDVMDDSMSSKIPNGKTNTSDTLGLHEATSSELMHMGNSETGHGDESEIIEIETGSLGMQLIPNDLMQSIGGFGVDHDFEMQTEEFANSIAAQENSELPSAMEGKVTFKEAYELSKKNNLRSADLLDRNLHQSLYEGDTGNGISHANAYGMRCSGTQALASIQTGGSYWSSNDQNSQSLLGIENLGETRTSFIRKMARKRHYEYTGLNENTIPLKRRRMSYSIVLDSEKPSDFCFKSALESRAMKLVPGLPMENALKVLKRRNESRIQRAMESSSDYDAQLQIMDRFESENPYEGGWTSGDLSGSSGFGSESFFDSDSEF